jgi:ABC-type Mn2+/Zn2+ transport system permease subunit
MRLGRLLLLLFTAIFLVVPAAIAFQFTDRQGVLAVIAWLTGALASASGLLISFHYDLPTGPIVVCMFGVLLLIAFGVQKALGMHAAVTEGQPVEVA